MIEFRRFAITEDIPVLSGSVCKDSDGNGMIRAKFIPYALTASLVAIVIQSEYVWMFVRS